MDPSSLARELNPPQLDAVTHTEGPLLVFAGAGSGKTRVITYRIANIVVGRGVPAWRVMAVTFTNKAAGEMRARITKLVGPDHARELWVATFHATGAKILRRYHDRAGLRRDFVIYDDSDQRTVMNRVYKELKLDDKLLAPRAVLGEIDRAKQEVLSPEDYLDQAKTPLQKSVAPAYAAYERRLAEANAVDFGDLIARVARLLESDADLRAELQERFAYVMVDEFQDTNNAQYRIVKAIVGPAKNICVVGDDDQAIYRWRGADVRNIQYFRRDFMGARVVKLEQNYRSTARILRAADAVISRAHTREAKVLYTRNPEGGLVEVSGCDDERDEARMLAQRIRGALDRGVSAREIAVFYRIHALSRSLEEGLRAADIPYVIVGGVRFYDRAEVKDVLAYLRLMLNPEDDVSFLRVVNTPTRKIGKTTLDRLTAHAESRKVTLWRLLEARDLPADVAPAAARALGGFYTLIRETQRKVAGLLQHPEQVAGIVYEDSGYQDLLADANDPENEARRENVAELLGSMRAYTEETAEPSLSDYLERVSLSEAVADGDTGECVSLMSVHSAKGLEFDTVFIAAMEDGMFPYKGMALGANPEEMEEERRLAYVAITRARKHLGVSYVRFRQIFGQTLMNGPSRFLSEMPAAVLSAPIRRRVLDAPSVTPTVMHSPKSSLVEITTVLDDDPGPSSHDGYASVTYRRGMRVKHPKFGPGTIRAVEPGDDPRVVVYFPSIGEEKKLLARFVSAL